MAEAASSAESVAIVRDAALVLSLPDVVVLTTMSYMLRASSFAEDDYEPGAHLAACLFLACTSCETPRRIRDVINALHMARTGTLLRDAHDYWRFKDRVLRAEQTVLKLCLGFDTAFSDRQVLLLHALQFLEGRGGSTEGAQKESSSSSSSSGGGGGGGGGGSVQLPRSLRDLSVALLNDCAGNATCELHPSRVLVVASITLAALFLEVNLPVAWSRLLEVEPSDQALAAVCHAMLDAYEPTQAIDGPLSIMRVRRELGSGSTAATISTATHDAAAAAGGEDASWDRAARPQS